MADDVVRDDMPTGPVGTGVTGVVRRISWSAIWAGVMAALGMEILFGFFGSFVGLRMYHWQAANPWSGPAKWSVFWFLVTVGWSMFFGAWCAARFSGNPNREDGVMHGIATWGLATTATIVLSALGSWAVLREGINVLATAAIAGAQGGPPSEAMTLPPTVGPIGQATANILSGISLRIWLGALIGLITALIGGWVGASGYTAMTAPGVRPIPAPTRRAA